MEVQHSDAINEIYDLFVSKIESEFNVDKYSSNYRKLDGELTLVVNNNELYVGFGKDVTVIFNFWEKEQQVIPILFDSGEWIVPSHSDWNKSNNVQKFDESYMNRVLRHFKAISKTN